MKEGLDFFYLVCNQGTKLNLIEAEFGITGFAVVVKLLQKIYGEKGYYCEWNDDVALLFADRTCRMQGGSVVSEIVKCAIRRNFFDDGMFKKYGILTSANIQEYYFEAAKRRKSVEVRSEYLLLSDDKIPNNVNIISKNVNINAKNADRNKQSKVEESKVNNTLSNDNVFCAEPETGSTQYPAVALILNDGTNYVVPQEDISLYIQTYPKVDVIQKLREMSLWCINNPQKRKTKRGIKRFIANWLSSEQDKGNRPQYPAVAQAQQPRRNKFCNYTPSYNDEKIAAIERMEREQTLKEIRNMNANG